MNDTVIFSCTTLIRETKSILTGAQLENFHIVPIPLRCHLSGFSAEHHNFPPKLHPDTRVIAVGSQCIAHIKSSLPPVTTFAACQADTCFHLLAEEKLVDYYTSRGYHLTTPAWVGSWKKYLADWKMERYMAIDFFSESSTKVVLLDTGADKNAKDNLLEFAEYVQRPAMAVEVGLDKYRRKVQGAIEKIWKRS